MPDRDTIRTAVSRTYAAALDRASSSGETAATRLAGYTAAQVAAVPDGVTASFFGCGNPLSLASVKPGHTVLDLGSGAGLDLILAGQAVGPTGRVIGIDMTDAQLAKAQRLAAAGAFANASFRKAYIESTGLGAASCDVVISNGVINLAPDKSQVFAEIHRVLRPGGRLYLADVVVQRELKEDVRNSPDLWAACIAGALPEPELALLALTSGLHDPRITERFDCFRDTSAEAKVARDLHVQAVNFLARK